MNSAAAIVAAGKSSHLPEAADIAAKSIDSGAAIGKLEALVQFTPQPNTSKMRAVKPACAPYSIFLAR
jgi:anthranilate phosphoribosyltransferase